ncbi:hypothetical protein IWQ60_002672 [Tieghemiomyces parasiticus]|uniref:Uncharacterized protein n=1 Tax=Tieghemiomyces parasiticus TaxID=78921 RepID=A0A9W8E0W2_9FUNG|nr:hypothetical protein IWQ60_002672 [Tieghemiomyces parasiticus]
MDIAREAAPLVTIRHAQECLATHNASIQRLLRLAREAVIQITPRVTESTAPADQKNPAAVSAVTNGGAHNASTDPAIAQPFDTLRKEELAASREAYTRSLRNLQLALQRVDQQLPSPETVATLSDDDRSLLLRTRDQLHQVALEKSDSIQVMVQRLASLQLALNTLIAFDEQEP